MTAKPVVLTIEITNESDNMVLIIQPSKRQAEKISVWLKDYKLGDLDFNDVIKVISEQVENALKKAGYEVRKKMPKVGDQISFKKSIGDIAVGDKGTIIDIEPERPYSYLVRVKDMEIFAKLDDFDLI